MTLAFEPVPLTFEPIYKEKVWGGRTLSRLGRRLPGDEATRIGESWELADLAQTSPSGGGGAAERSKVAGGMYAGRTLHDLLGTFGDAITGRLPLTDDGAFPLLVKFLDARENLSVQVHPSEAYAAAHDDAFLKSEAWYIVDAEPDAVIYKGLQPGTTPEQLRAALEANDQQAVTALLVAVPARPGDCHYLPSGTCHALGAGILVAEVQTPSDTTFRVFDWGRTGRELHIEAALACIAFGPAKTDAFETPGHIRTGPLDAHRLVRCPFFQIERVALGESASVPMRYDQPTVWMMLEGSGYLRFTGGMTTWVQGQTMLLPASLGEVQFESRGPATWLEVTFPAVEPMQIA